MRVLLTRPAAQSGAFAKAMTARFGAGTEAVISPVLEVVMLPFDTQTEAFDALVFTSQNGVAAYVAAGGGPGMTAYCVGPRTTEAARQAGLQAQSADGDIDALNAFLAREPERGRLLHVAGRHVAGEVQGDVTRVVGYEQRPVPLSRQALAMLRQPGDVMLPLFSPKSGRWFQNGLGEGLRADLHAVCISQRAREVLDPARYASIRICDRPDAEAMLDKMSEFFPASPA